MMVMALGCCFTTTTTSSGWLGRMITKKLFLPFVVVVHVFRLLHPCAGFVGVFVVDPTITPSTTIPIPTTTAIPFDPMLITSQQQQPSLFRESASTWLLSVQQQQQQPSKQDIALLRSAFAEFYGMDRNLEKSLELLTQTIKIWESKQLPNDELSALHRVRADCYMSLGDAQAASSDYDKSVALFRPLNEDDDEYEDQKQEYIAALLGRARANKNLAQTQRNKDRSQQLNNAYASKAASDYELALVLSSRDDYDNNNKIEAIMDGAIRNPYAAWEWGSSLRLTYQWEQAAQAHTIASRSFLEIGDRPRSIISLLDAGIDLAAAAASTNNNNNKDLVTQTENALRKAIEQTKGVSSRDIPLLRRVIAKEGEGRMALAATLWSNGQKSDAETYLGDACIRLEQMQAQVDAAAEKQAKLLIQGKQTTSVPPAMTIPAVVGNDQRVQYSIDDEMTPAIGLSCSKFKSPIFMAEKLGWPDSLIQKMIKLEKLRI